MIQNIDKEILKFLLRGSVYSELAIIKHFGITYDELLMAYSRMEQDGYLESYNTYQARNSCCASGCTHKCPVEKDGDKHDDIRMLTQKAINEFS